MKRSDLAATIDHTLLGPKSTRQGVATLCEEAIRHGVASACVDPCFASWAKAKLGQGPVKLCVVIGFPSGMSRPDVKAFEARRAIEDGADELDMVINVPALLDGRTDDLVDDIRAVCDVARDADRSILVKVILETALLTDDMKVAGARAAMEAGADFVKTSTGFGPGGATLEDVALLRATVGSTMGVKASGGIREYDTAVAMIGAGATRLGASRTVSILEGATA